MREKSPQHDPKVMAARLEARLQCEQREHELTAARLDAAEQKITLLEHKLAEAQRRQTVLEKVLAYREKRQYFLSPWLIQDYVRLLIWILFRPRILKDYRDDLDDYGEQLLKYQGSWLASSLVWLPVFCWVTVPWLSGDLPLDVGNFLTLLGGIGLAWLLNGLLGAQEDALSAIAAVFCTATVGLVTIAIVIGLPFGGSIPEASLSLGLVALATTMIAVTIAAIVTLVVADSVTAVSAVIVGLGVLLILFSSSTDLLQVAVLVGGAVAITAVLQERYKAA